MCLSVQKDIDKALENKLKIDGKITAYKVLDVVYPVSVERSFLQSPHRCKKYKAGWNKSNIRRKKIRLYENDYSHVSIGIHVYINLREAQYKCKSGQVIVPVTCYRKDYVAGGLFSFSDSAVFAKVFVKKSDYEKALKG